MGLSSRDSREQSFKKLFAEEEALSYCAVARVLRLLRMRVMRVMRVLRSF